jgi:ABC-type sulfate transport system permease subunit
MLIGSFLMGTLGRAGGFEDLAFCLGSEAIQSGATAPALHDALAFSAGACALRLFGLFGHLSYVSGALRTSRPTLVQYRKEHRLVQ